MRKTKSLRFSIESLATFNLWQHTSVIGQSCNVGEFVAVFALDPELAAKRTNLKAISVEEGISTSVFKPHL